MSTTTEAKPRIYGHFINGEVAHGARLIERRNPANGEVVAHFAEGDVATVQAAVAAARSTFDSGVWSDMPAADRSRVLLAAASAIRGCRDELAVVETRESGKPIRMSRGDVDGAASHFEYAAALAMEMHGDVYANLGPDALGVVIREPVGVAGLIIPWNFPALIFGQKVPYALAAGCSVIVKPSEFTSGTALAMAQMTQDAGVPAGVLNVVTGYGHPVGQTLVEHPEVDFISFTGSTATGRRIAEAAAKTSTKVSLELGGKGANIVFSDADLDAAVEGTLKAIFFNTGECCVAGSRLLIQDTVADEFVKRLVERTRALRTSDPLSDEADLGALIHLDHAAKVESYIQTGVDQGATVVAGVAAGDPVPDIGASVAPTISDHVTPEMRIFQEEIFGPVLSVTRFATLSDAVGLANDTEYGLGNTIWSKNIDTALTVARAIRSGTVWINNALEGSPQMPFGGVKASGHGREMGRAGFEEFTELKTCFIKTGPATPYFN